MRAVAILAQLALLSFPPGLANAAHAAVHYVAPNGVDSPDCTQPSLPCRHPQRAVLNSSNGDEIRIGGGTYVFDPSLDTCGPSPAALGAPAVVCVVNRQLTLRGGYSSADWSRPYVGGAATVIDGEDLRRALVVARTASPTSLTVDGVTITRGRGVAHVAESPPNAFGGGMEAIQADIVLRNVHFEANTVVGTNASGDAAYDAAGGALGLRSPLDQPPATAILEDVVFRDNLSLAGSNGGGSGRGGYGHGGALFTYGYVLDGIRLEFLGNEAHGGDAVSSDGVSSDGRQGDGLGGAASFEWGSQVTLTAVSAVQNLAVGGNASPSLATARAAGAFGGALFAEGHSTFPTSVTLIDSLVSQNSALGGVARSGGLARGGGMMGQEASFVISRTVVLENRAEGGPGDASGTGACSTGEAARGAADGGGMTLSRLSTASVSAGLSNVLVAANQAAMGATGCIPGGGGGGLAFQGLQATIAHSTIVGNEVEPFMAGHGLLVFGSPQTGIPGATVDLDHAILADHTAEFDGAAHVQASTTGSGSLDFGPTLVAGNFAELAGGGSVTGQGNLIEVASAGFVAPGAPQHDYRLTPDSDAVDAAQGSGEALDFENQSRTGTRDVGADELGSPPGIFDDGFESGGPCRWSSPC